MRQYISLHSLFILIVVAVALISLFNAPSLTGFSTLEEPEVFAGKDTYHVGDMAHISVVPADIEYSIEVYGPDSKLVAISDDFPVEKAGTYNVEVVLFEDNLTKEVSTSFDVVSEGIQSVPEEKIPQEDEQVSEEIVEESEQPEGEDFLDDNMIGKEIIERSENDKIKGPKDYDNKKKDVEFSDVDMSEKDDIGKDNQPIKTITIEKQGFKIKVRGAGKDKIKNAWVNKGVIHIDSIPIDEATISLPHKGVPSIGIAPKLYVKEDNESEFTQANAYQRDGVMYNDIGITDDEYVFNVEHFTDYYVNTSGGDYATLTDCLFAINNSADACEINEGGFWSINNSYNFYFISHAIKIASSDVVLDCNTSSIRGRGISGGKGIYVSGKNNITIRNCTIDYFNPGVELVGGINHNITHNTFTDNYNFGIYFNLNVLNSTVEYNNLDGNSNGIYLLGSKWNHIFNNTDTGGNYAGILLYNGNYNNSIIRNSISGYGGATGAIRIYSGSSYNNITNNILSVSTYGVRLDTSAQKNIVANNTITSGLSGVYISLSNTKYNNITRNTITSSGGYDVLIASPASNTSVWLNNLYGDGVYNTGLNSHFCVNNQGNFYRDIIAWGNIGSGDCGPANIIYPAGGEIFTDNSQPLIINWTVQSSQNVVNYSLFYTNDSAVTWYFINSTTGLNHSWNITSLENNNFTLRIIPNDGNYNGTVNYSEEFYILVNNPSSISAVLLNATSNFNRTTDNLTANPTEVSDPENDNVQVNYNWYINNVSDTVLDMPFTAPDSDNMTYDLSGYGNEGLVVNASWNGTAGHDGFGAFVFNESAYINMSPASDFPTTEGSISLWARFGKWDGFDDIIDMNNGGQNYNRITFERNNGFGICPNPSSNAIHFIMLNSTGDGGSVACSNTQFNTGSLYHIVGTWNSTTISIYVNGTLDRNETVHTTPGLPADQVMIGGTLQWADRLFNGTIDDVRIYNRSLSPQEVSLLYHNMTNITHHSATTPGQNWTAKATPIDEHGLNGSSVFSNSVSIWPDNEYVCSDPVSCEYTDITSALIGENNTVGNITITEPGIYVVSGAYRFNMSPTTYSYGIRINSSDVVLDCNGSSLFDYSNFSSEYSTGILVSGFGSIIHNVTVRNCSLYNYTITIYSDGVVNMTVHNNTIYDSIGPLNDYVTISILYTNTTGKGSDIYNNRIINSRGSGIVEPYNSGTDYIRDIEIFNNTIDGCNNHAIDATNATIYNNWVNHTRGFQLGSNVMFYNNTLLNGHHGDYPGCHYDGYIELDDLASNINITNNSVGSGCLYSVKLRNTVGSNVRIWNNVFLYSGISQEWSGGTYFCVNGIGNWYGENVSTSYIGNGTGAHGEYIGGDCGPANITMPYYQNFTAGSIMLNWTNQSSPNNISYYIFYANYFILDWTLINNTNDTSYNWSITGIPNNDSYYVKVVPFFENYNATNAFTTFRINVTRTAYIVNQTKNETSSPIIVNQTESVAVNENLTIRANITTPVGVIDTVWIKVWESVKNSMNVIWEGLLSLIAGDTSSGIWSVNITVNDSFTRTGVYNYTIYANETTNLTFETDGNFSVRGENFYVCSDANLCRFSNFTEALIAANNTNQTVTLLETAGTYAMPKGWRLYLPASSPAISINASNITFDCNRSEIKGNATGEGILLRGYDYVTIKRCNLTNYSMGILVDNSKGNNITLNTIRLSASLDMNLTGSANRSRIHQNNFYGKEVMSAGDANIFCYKGDPALDIDKDILLALNFQESESNITYDKSGYQNHGTLDSVFPGKNSGTKIVDGKFYKSALFDGVDDTINVSIDESLSTSDITVAFWMYLNEWNSGTNDGFVVKTSNDNWLDGFGFSDSDNSNQLNFWINSYNLHYANSTLDIVGGWHYIVGTYDKSNIKLYIDGSLMDSTPYTSDISHSSNDLFIGSGVTGTGEPGYYSDSRIDSVVIYNRTLSALEIFNLYNRGKGTGNFYKETSNSSNILYNLDDCGVAYITAPVQYSNHTGTIRIEWQSQTVNAGTPGYYLQYTNNSGIIWHNLGSTTSTFYNWGVSSLPDGDQYHVNVRPYNAEFNATNITSSQFGVHNSLPNITFISQKNLSSIAVDESNPTRAGETVNILVNVSDNYDMDTVWIDIWNTTRKSSIVWSGLFSLVQGTVAKGTWGINMTVNESFPELGLVNYTINANGTLNNSRSYFGNLSILDNEWICSNVSLCEYNSFSNAITGENKTNNTIYFKDSNRSYSGGSRAKYALYPSAGHGALQFEGSNITLNCQGSLIDGNRLGYGVLVYKQSNLILNDCDFAGFATGINLSDSNRSYISLSSATSNSGYGLYLNKAHNNTITYLDVSGNTAGNILLLNSDNNTLLEGNVSYSQGTGINISSSLRNRIIGIVSRSNRYSSIYISSSSNYNHLENCSFRNSTNASLVSISSDSNNVTASSFREAPSGYYALFITSGSLGNRLWLNNFYSKGVKNNGASTIFCVAVKSHLKNGVYQKTAALTTFGNYYGLSVNTSLRPTGTCGNLSVPFADSDSDSYYSLIDDCSDMTAYIYPGAHEECDDFDNDCDGLIDENACKAEKFPSAGTGTGGSAPMSGYQKESEAKQVDIMQNPIVTLYKGDIVSFSLKGTEQFLKLNKLYFDKANLSLESISGAMILNLNDSLVFDIDNDNITDLKIRLSSIEGSAALLELKELTMEVTKEPEVTPEEVIEAKPEEKPPVEEKPSGISGISEFVSKVARSGLIALILAVILISAAAGAVSYSRFIGNVKRAEDYIERGIEQGIPRSRIKRKLVESGWEPQIIDSIMSMHAKENMESTLKSMIEKAEKEGISKEDIRKSLLEKGWKESDIGKILK